MNGIKKQLAEKLYIRLAKEFDFEPYAIDLEGFTSCFMEVIEDSGAILLKQERE